MKLRCGIDEGRCHALPQPPDVRVGRSRREPSW
jgi:hypothetical protein